MPEKKGRAGWELSRHPTEAGDEIKKWDLVKQLGTSPERGKMVSPEQKQASDSPEEETKKAPTTMRCVTHRERGNIFRRASKFPPYSSGIETIVSQ